MPTPTEDKAREEQARRDKAAADEKARADAEAKSRPTASVTITPQPIAPVQPIVTTHAPAKVAKGPRFRVVHPTGGFQRGDVATLAQLFPLDPKLSPEERAEATKAGIDRLIGLGAVAPVDED